MNDGYIVVFDSGVGGLSVLSELIKIMPNERYIYFGDNDNAPYGQKGERELLSLFSNALLEMSFFPIKALVLACNTLSVTIIDDIKKMVSVPVFGVFPPVESYQGKNNKTLLLCTPNTAKKYALKFSGIDVLSLPYLAKDIEEKIFSLYKLDIDYHLLSGQFYSEEIKSFNFFTKYNRVILGCTHYFFVKNKILDHFDHQKILSGNKNTANYIKNYLIKSKSLVKYKRNELLFLGNNALFNQKVYTNVVNNDKK